MYVIASVTQAIPFWRIKFRLKLRFMLKGNDPYLGLRDSPVVFLGLRILTTLPNIARKQLNSD
jgi:hypothetical protein